MRAITSRWTRATSPASRRPGLLAAVAGDVKVAATAPTEDPTASSNITDAITALVSIGYSEKEAAKSVEKAAKDVGEDDLEALVRAAMRP
ncbi:MAG: Holliday junction resolvasome RuvABC DNA-binding subunit [Planctomycetota bacterium]|jgi:Holliday junction resolvasome RuvABC DNA-binding subunit